MLGNEDQVNRNTPLNLIWETVQCSNSLLTPYSRGRMHTGELPLPLPAGEATRSPRLPNHSTAAAGATSCHQHPNSWHCTLLLSASRRVWHVGKLGRDGSEGSHPHPGQTPLSIQARRSPQGLVTKSEFVWLHTATMAVFKSNIFALSRDFGSKISPTSTHVTLGTSRLSSCVLLAGWGRQGHAPF